ncbi:MAG: 2-hydroxychromene-2-carboxylate isomerase [Solirubrobacteraceae bacterium]|nr:MAG: disulfide bond formation protein DsbA [Solirubrobacterales bacterium]
MAAITFYFDLGSPFVYLAAERLPELLPQPTRWQPLSLGALFKLTGRSSWAVGDETRRAAGMADVERRAASLGLPPVRWPDGWPGNYLFAMRAATFAFERGRGYEFTMRALRDAFQRGRDLTVPDHVLDAARAVGLDASAVQAATEDPQIKLALREATDAAHRLGVFGVPTLAVDKGLFWGEDRLDDALAQLRN